MINIDDEIRLRLVSEFVVFDNVERYKELIDGYLETFLKGHPDVANLWAFQQAVLPYNFNKAGIQEYGDEFEPEIGKVSAYLRDRFPEQFRSWALSVSNSDPVGIERYHDNDSRLIALRQNELDFLSDKSHE